MDPVANVAPTPPFKRIAVFLDGTWNTVNDNTNVWRLKALCATKDEHGVQQAIYYNAGVGTTFGSKVRGGMFGYGLNDNIIHAYQWLIEQYNEGDELFIFGFSRGAYTARSLSGFISKCGLLKPGAPLSVKQLYDRYRRASASKTLRTLQEEQSDKGRAFDVEERWMLSYAQAIDVKFVGVWDTVGALGIPLAGLRLFGNKDMQFLNTGLRLTNKYAYHALAIDEHRKIFAPTLWTKDIAVNLPKDPSARPVDQVEQRWFVGAHANVGGGCYSDLLAQAPLKWLMEKAMSHGLAFKQTVEIEPDMAGCAISDSYAEFMYGWYKRFTWGQEFYRGIGHDPVVAGDQKRYVINETIDSTVFERWQLDANYRPPSLVDWATRRQCRMVDIRFAVRADDPTTPVIS